MKHPSSDSARVQMSGPCTTTSKPKPGKSIGSPAVGKSWSDLLPDDAVQWPDTTGASLDFRSVAAGVHRSFSFRFRAAIKTRVIALMLLGGIALFAVHHNEIGLLKAVVSAIGAGHGPSGPPESPP